MSTVDEKFTHKRLDRVRSMVEFPADSGTANKETAENIHSYPADREAEKAAQMNLPPSETQEPGAQEVYIPTTQKELEQKQDSVSSQPNGDKQSAGSEIKQSTTGEISSTVVLTSTPIQTSPDKVTVTKGYLEGNQVSKVAALVGEGKKQLLHSLDLNQGQEVKLVNLVSSSVVQPLPQQTVVDESGRISQIIYDFQSKYDINFVPVSLTCLKSWVRPKEHEIMELFGETYFYTPVVGISSEATQYAQDISIRLKQGELVKESLFKVFNAHGASYKTLRFTQEELSQITTLLSNYDPKVLQVGQEDMLLVVGDYLYVG